MRHATIESAEIVVTAVVGMMGIRPTVEAIKARKDIALGQQGDTCVQQDILL